MPSFITHDIITREVFNKIDNSNIDLNTLRMYSLGGDLCRFSKCRRLSHKINKDKYIEYIKNNINKNDKYMNSFLYGHISHIIIDDIFHKYIHKIEKEYIKGSIKTHTLIEGYIDYYLCKKIYNIELDNYKFKDIFKGKFDYKIYKLVNDSYKYIYNIKYVGISYFLSLIAYFLLGIYIKIVRIKNLSKIYKYKEFKEINKINIDKDIDRLYKECIDKVIDKFSLI